jgi:hypothetical protein
MKTIRKLLFLALIYQCAPSALVAQANRPVKSVIPEKPMLFNRLPQKFECTAASLRKLFSSQVNDFVRLPLVNADFFAGTVSTRVQVDSNVTSINILSSNFPGTMLNVSLMKQADGTEKITGMFLNPRNGDMMMIEKENDHYFIRKALSKFVMTECPLPEDVNAQTSF